MLAKIETTSGQFLIVETNPQEISNDIKDILPNLVEDVQKRGSPTEADVEQVSKANLKKASALLKTQIENLSSMVHSSVRAAKPSKAVVEASVGFAGETDIIPFITSVQSEGSIKITLEWTFHD